MSEMTVCGASFFSEQEPEVTLLETVALRNTFLEPRRLPHPRSLFRVNFGSQ
jgi:hypothetical protein